MTTLYERLGGQPAIHAVVEGMYKGIFNDPDLIDFFRKTDKQVQKDAQERFLIYATGGSPTWEGKSMKEAHQGRGITSKEFGLVAGHVINAMKELAVPQELQDEVVALLMTVKPDTVEDE